MIQLQPPSLRVIVLVIIIILNDYIKFSIANKLWGFAGRSPGFYQGIPHVAFHVKLFDDFKISSV